MTGVGDRAALWRGAAILDALDLTTPPCARYRELERPDGGWAMEDVLTAGEWPVADLDALPAFLCCVAAAGFARNWQATLDGAALRRRIAALGPNLVEAALDLEPLCLPDPVEARDEHFDRTAYLDVGRRLLQACLPGASASSDLSAAQGRLALDAGVRLFQTAAASHA
jgi:hypothetical protein